MNLRIKNIIIILLCSVFLVVFSGCTKNKSRRDATKHPFPKQKHSESKGYSVNGETLKPGEKKRIRMEDVDDHKIIKSKSQN